MPYIKQGDRVKFNEVLSELPPFTTKGELEYCIFYLMKEYMTTRDFNYSNLHDTVYAAIHCGDEYRRRFLDKREDDANLTNGDV
jgi:hypothetical protein